MENSKYFLGLDIGTNSVGWSVTDDNYNILNFNGKKMWGTDFSMREALLLREEAIEPLEEVVKERLNVLGYLENFLQRKPQK